MITDDILKQGFAALKAGRNEEARNLLMQVLEQDESNEMAWLWLSGTVDTDGERRICLENVLAINPSNEQARRGLDQLIAKKGVQSLTALSPSTSSAEPAPISREKPTQPPAASRAPDVAQWEERKETRKLPRATKQRTLLIVGLGAVFLLLTGIALLGIPWVIDGGLLQFGRGAPVAADITQVSPAAGAISSPVPSPTRTSTVRPTPTLRPTWTPGPWLGSRERPVPFGEALVLGQARDPLRIQFAVTGVSRGDEAWQILYAENMFNEEPPLGMEYILLYVEVQCLEGSSDAPLQIGQQDFNLLSKGRIFEPEFVFGLEPEIPMFRTTLISGGSVGGWIAFLVHMDDLDPLLVTGMDRSEVGGFYFAVESSSGPAATPTPTPAPIPTVAIQTQELGPIWSSTRDESYTVQISLTGVRFNSGDEFSRPKQGYVYVIVDISVKNLGPNVMRSVGWNDFQVHDANGVLRDSEDWLPDTDDCWLEFVDLTLGGSVSGCVGFEVPIDGTLELIYAPYRYEGLQPGRYLSFTIRQ